MVEKFRKIFATIKNEKGGVFIFALMKMDELTDKWTVVLSAPWAVEGDAEVFKYILDLIKTQLLPEEVSTVARISIFPQTDHLIEMLSKYASGASISGKINGNQIHEGYIIEANSNPSTIKPVEQLSL